MPAPATGRSGEARGPRLRGQPTDKLPELGEDSPRGRPGQPVELAPIYVTLASAEASYTTDQVHGASGGTGVG